MAREAGACLFRESFILVQGGVFDAHCVRPICFDIAFKTLI
jgi:hypothetical protein